jgi:hypothetical protein
MESSQVNMYCGFKDSHNYLRAVHMISEDDGP